MKILITTLCFLCMFAFVTESGAQHHGRKTVKVKKVHKAGPGRARAVKVTKVSRYPRNKVVVVKRRPVRTVTVLPAGYSTVVYKKVKYYHHAGYYYNYTNNNYVIIAPPRGIRIKVLPVGYRTVLHGGVTRYYYRGVYYSQVQSAYVISDPVVGTVVPELPMEDVEEVTLDGKTYYKYHDILYKTVVTTDGTKYEVVGRLDD